MVIRKYQNGLSSRRDTEISIDSAEVIFDRPHRDTKSEGDLFVRLAGQEVRNDLPLPVSELMGPSHTPIVLRKATAQCA